VTALRHFTVFGERNSGTNYLEKLIARNFAGLTPAPRNFGWKHGGLDRRWWQPGLTPQPLHDHARDAAGVLFIVIHRNPVSWLLSMHRIPHHAPFHVNVPLSVFLRMEWSDYYNERGPGDDIAPDPDRRFALGRARNAIERFPSIFDLRREKIERFTAYATRLPQVVFVTYEAVAANPAGFLNALAEITRVPRLPVLAGVEETKFGTGRFVPREDETVAAHDFEHIAARLSWYHEHLVGYCADFDLMRARLAEAGDGPVAVDGLVGHLGHMRHMAHGGETTFSLVP
jgi:hypothetical protein